ncbi:hypothetical protein IE81DRAFT_151471 [Ceraceosorus guamensis]|uniref:Uncharacterized protein n=1 Tax=Ceraceosorus guamensis TaxID=1522189 RepID=A0A316VWN7_9BASI|nr:hypothetical protein IE81DRAFT_151471 [Ceraceosorus guamensis]PWN41859.1 hypothetical protein IE81DRAFT_151471 [Ceraceosorus guamensis]
MHVFMTQDHGAQRRPHRSTCICESAILSQSCANSGGGRIGTLDSIQSICRRTAEEQLGKTVLGRCRTQTLASRDLQRIAPCVRQSQGGRPRRARTLPFRLTHATGSRPCMHHQASSQPHQPLRMSSSSHITQLTQSRHAAAERKRWRHLLCQSIERTHDLTPSSSLNKAAPPRTRCIDPSHISASQAITPPGWRGRSADRLAHVRVTAAAIKNS